MSVAGNIAQSLGVLTYPDFTIYLVHLRKVPLQYHEERRGNVTENRKSRSRLKVQLENGEE